MRSLRNTPSVRFFRRILPAGAALACFVGAAPARATLGADVSSVAVNHANLGGVVHVTPLGQGERHELTLPSGVVVRQYVVGGTVYAIAWSGPRPPNLRELLGTYFSKLDGGSGGSSHHRMSLKGADFRVETMAHRGSFTGRAWVPSLVPAGVDVGVLP
jgi:hypothetical protein